MKLPKLKFWDSWDDRQKSNAVKGLGVAIAIFALFTLLATVSYVFTWRQDQSLLRDPAMMDQAQPVANAGGKLGLKWANVLICKWFGLGSFAFLILLFAMAVRLVAGRWHRSLLKTAIVTLSGAIIASFLFALTGRLAGIPTMFGAGIGGECGAFVVDWLANLVGVAVTALLLVALSVGWLFLSSGRFSRWVTSLGAAGDAEPEAAEMPEPAPVHEPEPAPVQEPVAAPAPVRVTFRTAGLKAEPEETVAEVSEDEGDVAGGTDEQAGSFEIDRACRKMV